MITNIRKAVTSDIEQLSMRDLDLLIADFAIYGWRIVGDDENGNIVRVDPAKVQINTVTTFKLIESDEK